jgi:catechol-2,3-dioxygenase
MVQGPRLIGVVVYVRDLDRSVTFYRELLGLEVIDSSPTAALLACGDGCHLVLRATGAGSPRALGAIGLQYVTWMMPSRDDLDRAETLLKNRSAYVETRTNGSTRSVEGHDPDDLTVVLAYSTDNQMPLRELPSRIYAW